jgi:hypothetical protein
VAQDQRQPFLGTQVGEPIPCKDTFDGDDPIVPIGRNGLEQGVGTGGHIAVQHARAVLTQDTHIHGAGMQGDATVTLVLFRGEAPEVSSSLERDMSYSQHTTGVC